MGGNSPLEKEELVAKIEKGLGSKEEEEEEGRVKKKRGIRWWFTGLDGVRWNMGLQKGGIRWG